MRILMLLFMYAMSQTMTLAADSIGLTLAFDKTTATSNAPIGLLVTVSNLTDQNLSLFWADAWPPPLREGVSSEIDVNQLLLGEAALTIKDKTGKLVFEYPKLDKSGAKSDLAPIPPGKIEQLEAKSNKAYRLKLALQLAPGEYELECRLPAVALSKGGAALRLSHKLPLKLEDEVEVSKTYAPKLSLEKMPMGFAIKCALTPPPNVKMEMPYYRDGNCKIVIRDAQGQPVFDEIYRPNGDADGIQSWNEPLEWSIPLSVDYYFKQKPGKYTVEFSYRDYALSSSERKKSPQDSDTEWRRYLTAADMKQNLLIWNKPWTPVEGKWVIAVKKFDCEVTPAMLTATKTATQL